MLFAKLRKPTATETALQAAGFIASNAQLEPGEFTNQHRRLATQQAKQIRRALLKSGLVMQPETRAFLTEAYQALSSLGDKRAKQPTIEILAPLLWQARQVGGVIEGDAETPSPRLLYMDPDTGMEGLYYRHLMHKPDPSALAAELTGLVLSDADHLPNPTKMPDSLIAGEYARKVRHALNDSGKIMDRDTHQLLTKAHNVFLRLSTQNSRLRSTVSRHAPPGLQLPRDVDPRWRIDFRHSLNELRGDAERVRDRMVLQVGDLEAPTRTASQERTTQPVIPQR